MNNLIYLSVFYSVYIMLVLFLSSIFLEIIDGGLKRRGGDEKGGFFSEQIYKFLHKFRFNIILKKTEGLNLVLLSMVLFLFIQSSLFFKETLINLFPGSFSSKLPVELSIYILVMLFSLLLRSISQTESSLRKKLRYPFFSVLILSCYVMFNEYCLVLKDYDVGLFGYILQKVIFGVFFICFFWMSKIFCLVRNNQSNSISFLSLPYYFFKVFWFSFLLREVFSSNFLNISFQYNVITVGAYLLIVSLMIAGFDFIDKLTTTLSRRQEERLLYKLVLPGVMTVLAIFFAGRLFVF